METAKRTCRTVADNVKHDEEKIIYGWMDAVNTQMQYNNTNKQCKDRNFNCYQNEKYKATPQIYKLALKWKSSRLLVNRKKGKSNKILVKEKRKKKTNKHKRIRRIKSTKQKKKEARNARRAVN